MRTFALVLFAAFASSVIAKCPNNCSGHGSCSEDDVCRCWPNYQGFDCSQRTCPFTEAWAANAGDPHEYAECANRGTCDRATGECKCVVGYSGRGCERSDCPNSCSGHGKCRMLQDFPNFSQDNTLSWDEKSIQGCICDGGYMSADCSQRICPYGDDPVTVCQQGYTEQVQQITFTIRADLTSTSPGVQNKAFLVNDDFYLRYETPQGEVYATKRVTGAFGTAGDNAKSRSAVVGSTVYNVAAKYFDHDGVEASMRLEAALESLPNFAIRDVTVTKTAAADTTVSGNAVTQVKYQVTFHHERDGSNTYGEQNLLACPNPTWGCSHAGCRPLVKQPYLVTILENDAAGGNYEVQEGVLTRGLGAATITSTIVGISSDSVLECPTGKTCGSTASTMDAAIYVLLSTSATGSVKVYIKTLGNGNGGFLTYSQYASAGPTYASDVSAYTYAGVLTADNYASFDVSSFVPNTRLEFASPATFVASTDYAAVILYTLPSCSVSDITGGASTPFSNIDIENIECSGRGICGRDVGECKCFEGYYGLNCGQQTVLV